MEIRLYKFATFNTSLMKYLLTAACLVFYLLSLSQVFPPVDYPRDYFRDPLNIPISLAANFGELRPNHYHMGLDIRTLHRENLPVLAAADGYVAKVVIEPGGFGQAVYIRHPNGYTSLYAHLNQFFPALAAYVEAQQYRLESWQVALEIPAGLFPVKKGDLIALSGNRGGSQGPHLHFEIRRTEDDTNLNPLLFGLPVPDKTAPAIQRLAVYDRTQSTYEQSPLIFPVHKVPVAGPAAHATRRRTATAVPTASTTVPASSAARYAITPSLLILASPRVSFAISAFDTQTGSANPNGIYQALLYEDDQPLTGFRMNNISYNDTRNINAHIDYKTRETGGPFLQHLSQLPGYTPPTIYRSATAALPGSDGVIDCSDGAIHNIRIEVRDVNGNVAELRYQVQYPAAGAVRTTPSVLPGKIFYPGMLDGTETEDCAFYIGEKSLYDSVHIDCRISGYPGAGHSLPGAVSALHTIGAAFIPLREPLLVRIRPNTGWTDTARSKVVMVCMEGERKDVQRPEWQGGWASARFRSFGSFQLVEDEEAPVIRPIGFSDGAILSKSARIAFTVKDNLGALRNVRADLDGKWLCFTNDKGLAYIYTFDAHCPPGKHTLHIVAEDVAGNVAIQEYTFTR